MKDWWQRIQNWVEHRTGVWAALGPILTHPAPRGARWWYVFGSATMTLLGIQILTGICLAMVYVPSSDQVYESLEYLNYTQPLGWLLRAIHNTAASGMFLMAIAHMTQVFLMGAFKFPREATWLVGVLLLVLTLGMCFTGQVLRWDASAYWGVGVGASMAGRVPIIGPWLVEMILGGNALSGQTLSRFFSLHVFVIPGLLLGSLGVHLFLVLRHGISEPPTPGKPVDPATYEKEYHAELETTGEPFFPAAVQRDMIFSFLTVVAVVLIAAVVGPEGPDIPADPTLFGFEPKPDWYFLPAYSLLALSPPELEMIVMLVLPVIGLLVLCAVPFLFGKGERSPARRPVAVVSVLMCFIGYCTLLYLGFEAPWSPEMGAWSGDPVPQHMVQEFKLTPRELQGAVVFQNKDCRNCHALKDKEGHATGGRRGPDLTLVGTRLDHDELIRQVIQGGGNMPAFGDQLSPLEVEALVAFLGKLRPQDQPPMRSPVAYDN